MEKIGEIAIAYEAVLDVVNELQELQKQYPDYYLEIGEVVHGCNPYEGDAECGCHSTFEVNGISMKPKKTRKSV